MFVVVRITCGLAVKRPPAALVVPSRAIIFMAAALRAGSRLAIAARSAALTTGGAFGFGFGDAIARVYVLLGSLFVLLSVGLPTILGSVVRGP